MVQRWRGRQKWGPGWGTRVNPWLIHVNVCPKPLQYWKVVSLWRIKINGQKMVQKMLFYSYESSCLCISHFSTVWHLNTTITLRGTLVITMIMTSYQSQNLTQPYSPALICMDLIVWHHDRLCLLDKSSLITLEYSTNKTMNLREVGWLWAKGGRHGAAQNNQVWPGNSPAGIDYGRGLST